VKYLGSKLRTRDSIMPLILSGRRHGQLYVEPFVGGANSFEVAENPRLGADVNPYLIACLTAIATGWIPPHTVTEDEYRAIKNNKDAYAPELVGFVGFGCSFSTKWWGGYARDKQVNVEARINYARSALNNALEQTPRLRGATFVVSSYDALPIPPDSIVYCDPPYEGTTGYKGAGKFDHGAFWKWAADIAQHSRVYVSEYAAPEGWECIWARNQTTNINKKQGMAFTSVERLFVPAHQLRRLL